MIRHFLLFLILTGAVEFTGAQSIYHFKYRLKTDSDTTLYDAFFVSKDDGSGTVRVKYRSPFNGEAMLVDMNVQEEYPDMASGNQDYNKFDYRLSAPRVIKGNAQTTYAVPMFWFKKNETTRIFEPWGVTSGTANPDVSINLFESVEFLELKDLKESLVLDYYTPQDTLYNNLFVTRSRALSPAEKNIRLKMIIVANVGDQHIGASCALDRQRVSETYRKIAKLMGIGIDSIIISGANYSKQNLERALDTFKAGPNDIVIFYYSGHGFRAPKDGRRYPYMLLKVDIDDTYLANSLNVEDVYNRIQKKGARLNLVFTDCCNTDVTTLNADGTVPPVKKGLGMDWYLENARALFLDPKPVSILYTAADVDQRASSNNEFGGFFTFYLRQAFEDQLGYFSQRVSWENIFDKVTKQTVYKAQHTYCDKPYIPANICDQEPVGRITRGN